MNELKDLQPTFDTLRETIPPPTRMAKNRAAFLQHAKTVTENQPVRPLGWSAPAFSTNGFGSGRNKPMRKRTIIALAVALMMVSTALAQQIIEFYTRNDDHSVIVLNDNHAFDGQMESIVSASLEAVVSTLPFAAQLPTFLPDSYRLEAAQYNENLQALDVIYSCEGNPAYGFTLFQISSNTELSPIDIGANAIIETVQIRDAAGQFVQGGWIVVEPAEPPEGVTSLEAETVWDNELPMFSLNWESEGMRYSMSNFIGSSDQSENPACLLDKNTGIHIAESLAYYTP